MTHITCSMPKARSKRIRYCLKIVIYGFHPGFPPPKFVEGCLAVVGTTTPQCLPTHETCPECNRRIDPCRLPPHFFSGGNLVRGHSCEASACPCSRRGKLVPAKAGMCLASVVFLVARPSWPCIHGLEARATSGNCIFSPQDGLRHCLAKHILGFEAATQRIKCGMIIPHNMSNRALTPFCVA